MYVTLFADRQNADGAFRLPCWGFRSNTLWRTWFFRRY